MINRFLDPQILAGIANLELTARTVVEGFISGLHRSPHFGFSQEFAEFRPYVPGDDLRYVDWNVYARTERLYLKKYQGETNTRVTVLPDASASMDFKRRGLKKIDYAPFREAARLLYDGPWVAERYAAIRAFIEAKPDSLHPVTRRIIETARSLTAVGAFEATDRLAALRRRCEAVWADIDVLLTPTAGTIYTVAEVEADPIRLNSNLGYYTNHMNLLDLCGLAVPAGFLSNGLPWGVTLSAPAFCDKRLLGLGAKFLGEEKPARVLASTTPVVQVAVCGAHLSGLPLNGQLTALGATLVRAARTAPTYRLYALPDASPPKPGLVRVASGEGGSAIEVEVWELPETAFGRFVAAIPGPLGIGTIALDDGSRVQGFLCEAAAVRDARDITALGGWRAFLATRP